MQTQWAKANIRSETKDTPVRSQGGSSSYYLRELILTGGLFKAISKLLAVHELLRVSGHDQSLESRLFTEEDCKGKQSQHDTPLGCVSTEDAVVTIFFFIVKSSMFSNRKQGISSTHLLPNIDWDFLCIRTGLCFFILFFCYLKQFHSACQVKVFWCN